MILQHTSEFIRDYTTNDLSGNVSIEKWTQHVSYEKTIINNQLKLQTKFIVQSYTHNLSLPWTDLSQLNSGSVAVKLVPLTMLFSRPPSVIQTMAIEKLNLSIISSKVPKNANMTKINLCEPHSGYTLFGSGESMTECKKLSSELRNQLIVM